jgi:primosomal protein N' (replication factor Y) (superfamily II helicase)
VAEEHGETGARGTATSARGTARPGRAKAPRRRSPVAQAPAAHLPVARILVDVPLAHLDRPFDYLVPERLSESAVPGCRVRVRFAGQLVGGYLLDRVAVSEHQGRLAALERVVSPERVLTPEIAALAREVADRYAGTMADVLRLAIPPRHAGAETAARPRAASVPDRAAVPGAALAHGAASAPDLSASGVPGSAPARGAAGEPGAARLRAARVAAGGGPPVRPEAGPWARYQQGQAFLAALADGRAPRAVWTALPGQDWPEEIARAAGTAAAAGRGALIVVPDARDLSLVDAALARTLGPGRHVSLAAGLGPAERYRRWLAVARGEIHVVAGTRAAMFAPVAGLGLVVIWDDGDDLHAEPRAPYPHAREVLALRAHRARAAALFGGFARTAEATSLVASGWARAVTAPRDVVRRFAPDVRAAGDDAELARDEAARTARIPSLALRAARAALDRGPVLVQVPRRGYLAAVACERCRAAARCVTCGGPMAVAASGAPAGCRWCGRSDAEWRCPACGHGRLRAVVAGSRRTAEELARAFPGAPVVVSAGAATINSIPPRPALVVATPGAEPQVDGGYAAAVLLDGWVLLGRPSLAAAQEALRRWLNAAALTAPGSAGGTVVLVAEAALPVAQALIRWDPVTHAERELAEREMLGFPPAVRMAAVTGSAGAVAGFLAETVLPAQAEVIGTVPAGPGPAGADKAGGDKAGAGNAGADRVQALIRVPRPGGLALAAALRQAQASRTARKDTGQVRVQLDPTDLI